MVPGFELEGPDSIPAVNKDPPNACGVRAHEFRDSESPNGLLLAVYQGVVSGEKIPSSVSDISKLWRLRYIVLPSTVKRQKWNSCHCKMGLASQE